MTEDAKPNKPDTRPGKNKLEMDNPSIIHFLNYILKALKSDRRIALDNFQDLSAMYSFREDGAGSSLSESIILADIVDSKMKFLNSSSGSIEKMIKIAKIMSDTVNKTEVIVDEGEISDYERGLILEAANEFTRDSKKILREVK